MAKRLSIGYEVEEVFSRRGISVFGFFCFQFVYQFHALVLYRMKSISDQILWPHRLYMQACLNNRIKENSIQYECVLTLVRIYAIFNNFSIIEASCLTFLKSVTWWRHQMETFSVLLAICAGNSPGTGEFPAQRPVTRSFDVFVDQRLNKRLSKQS